MLWLFKVNNENKNLKFSSSIVNYFCTLNIAGVKKKNLQKLANTAQPNFLLWLSAQQAINEYYALSFHLVIKCILERYKLEAIHLLSENYAPKYCL